MDIDLSWWQWLGVWLAIGAGAALQGAIGFGLALLAGPFLVMIHPGLMPGPMLVTALLLTLLTARREWHGVRVREVALAMVGRIPGSALGALLLTAVPLEHSRLLFGGIILAGVGLSVAGWHLRPTPRGMVIAGLLSGIMGTAGAVGGPPMALIYQNAPGVALRGTLSFFFVVGSTISMIALALAGRFGPGEVMAGLATLPGILAGFWVSGFLAGRLDQGHTRKAILGLSFVAGVAVVVQALMG